MKKYNVHYTGYYGYDVIVEAESEEKAKEIAEMYEANEKDYYYEPNGVDVWEADEDDEVTYDPDEF